MTIVVLSLSLPFFILGNCNRYRSLILLEVFPFSYVFKLIFTACNFLLFIIVPEKLSYKITAVIILTCKILNFVNSAAGKIGGRNELLMKTFTEASSISICRKRFRSSCNYNESPSSGLRGGSIKICNSVSC